VIGRKAFGVRRSGLLATQRAPLSANTPNTFEPRYPQRRTPNLTLLSNIEVLGFPIVDNDGACRLLRDEHELFAQLNSDVLGA